MRFPYTMFTLQSSFTFAKKGGGDSLVEVTVNGKEENSSDFCPNYFQEFGLRSNDLQYMCCISLDKLVIKVSLSCKGSTYSRYITLPIKT